MIKKSWCGLFTVVCALALAVAVAAPAAAQMSEVKEKPPMYSYVSDWAIPRAQWGDMEKADAADQKLMKDAFAAGTIIAYGSDTTMVHTPDGYTHDGWWSAMSMAGLLNVLEQEYKSGSPTAPVYVSATKHSDSIYVSRDYNWHSGSWKGVYTRVAVFNLKPDAPNNAVETLSKNLFVPLFEKMLADGSIHEYEVDTEEIHTDDPGTFAIVMVAANADGLDKFDAAVASLGKSNPLAGTALGSMVDLSKHRDYLMRTNVTFK
ncbi:MAG TPA: hypothetical protein VL983_02600 [Terriglobales bacterium]|nr:hypothetical protein [Terriglobales bacterium]